MTQNTIKRSAYAAIGIPVDIANKLRDRVASTRRTIDDARERLSDQARTMIDEWADEGERLIAMLSDRATDVRENTEKSADDLRRRFEEVEAATEDVAQGITTAATKPFASLETVDGIGPAFAKRLRKAGVLSTAALVERTSTQAGIARLAKQTDIPTTSIESWASDADLTRINGIGEEFMALLNAAGIGSISGLADAKADELRSEIVSVHADSGLGENLPSQAMLEEWIKAAKRMS